MADKDKLEVTEAEIKEKIGHMTGLTHYRGWSDAKIRERAIELATEQKKAALELKANDVLGLSDMFSNKDEVKEAIALSKVYTQEFTLDTISDKESIRQLVYLEICQKRYQKFVNDAYGVGTKGKSSIPASYMKMIHENLEQIRKLKVELGLSKKDDKGNSVFDVVQGLKDKFKKWREDNNGSRTLVCPHCGKLTLLRIRMSAWRAQKHPYFKDRFLYNEHLIKLYLNQKITKKDVANILQVSTDYVDWMIENGYPVKGNNV